MSLDTVKDKGKLSKAFVYEYKRLKKERNIGSNPPISPNRRKHMHAPNFGNMLRVVVAYELVDALNL